MVAPEGDERGGIGQQLGAAMPCSLLRISQENLDFGCDGWRQRERGHRAEGLEVGVHLAGTAQDCQRHQVGKALGHTSSGHFH